MHRSTILEAITATWNTLDNSFFVHVRGGAVVKNLPAKDGDTRDPGLVPGSGRSPGEDPLFLPGKSYEQCHKESAMI